MKTFSEVWGEIYSVVCPRCKRELGPKNQDALVGAWIQGATAHCGACGHNDTYAAFEKAAKEVANQRVAPKIENLAGAGI